MTARSVSIAPCLAVIVIVGVAACAPKPGETPKVFAPQDVAGVRKGEGDYVQTISGTIESIRFQNINKALGYYTYNVELVVARADAEPISVRVDKVFWSRTRPAVRDAIAPEGPKQELRPTTWREWTVGGPVELRALVTSSGYARMVE